MPATQLEDAAVQQHPMPLPAARGPVGAAVLRVLRGGPGEDLEGLLRASLGATEDLLRDEDLQLALFCLHEVHHGGFAGVPDDLEWSPTLSAARLRLERDLEAVLRRAVVLPQRPEPTAAAVADALLALTAAAPGPSPSSRLARHATPQQAREFLVQRSISALKGTDPYGWAVPRLDARSKAALVEIQSREHGAGRPGRSHSAVFAGTMRSLGLDDASGAYVDVVPAVTLTSVNILSMFSLNRRLRGALVGHLAASRTTSSVLGRFAGDGLRPGVGEGTTRWSDERVEADAAYEQIAACALAGGVVEAEPDLVDDVLFGAAARLLVDRLQGEHVLERWAVGGTSLLVPLPAETAHA